MFQNPKRVLLLTAQDASGLYYFTIASRDLSGFARLGRLIGEGIGHSSKELEALLGKCETLSESVSTRPCDGQIFVSHFYTASGYPHRLAADGFFDKREIERVGGFQDYLNHVSQHVTYHFLGYFASAQRTN